MYGMFSNSKIQNLDALKDWNTESMTSLNSAFYNCSQLSDLSGLAGWNTANLSDMNGAFQNCTSLTSLHGLENWDVHSLKSMSCTFQDAGVNDISALANWQTSVLSNTCQTFNGTKISDLTPLTGWDMSQNSGPSGMFSNMENLTSLHGTENWDLSGAHAFGNIFDGSNRLKDVSAMASWKINETKWKNLQNLLSSPAIEKVDLSTWNLSNANINNQTPNVYGFRPCAIKLSSIYLSTNDANKTALIDGNGADNGYGNQYMSADLAHGPMSSSEILEGWQDDWAGWWGLAVNVTLSDGTNEKTVKMPMLCDVTLPMDTFTKVNHELVGWTDEAGNVYDAEHPYTVAKASSQKLTAKWNRTVSANTTVSFNANGGSGEMGSVEAESGSVITVPENSFTWAKHEFTGWNTAADGSGTAYAPGASITAGEEDAAVTLYAQWNYLPSHTSIFFNANGGTGTMEGLRIEEDKSANLPKASLSREGYAFTGWNTRSDGSGTVYADEAQITAGQNDASIVLYAQWEKVIDLSQLQEAMDYAAGLNMTQFVSTGKEAFSTQLAKARVVLENPNTQAEVNDAADKLNKAALALRRIADPAALDDLNEWSDDYL